MFKLYGIDVSNFCNMVKHTFLEKSITFTTVPNTPSQDADYLAKSPMGKVPCVETPDGFLSETNVIMDYLEEMQPEPALLPIDAYDRAKVRELMRIAEHYIDAPSRRHGPAVFFGAPRSESAVTEVRPVIERGMLALESRLSQGPYAFGDQFTLADIFIFHAVGFAKNICLAIYEWDITEGHAKLHTVLDHIAAREATVSVIADQQKALAEFMANKAD